MSGRRARWPWAALVAAVLALGLACRSDTLAGFTYSAELGAPALERDQPSFDASAFPPTLPPTDYHADAWMRTDCLLCHETGVRGAPLVVHRGMSYRLLKAKCRTCHVPEPRGEFWYDAFPPVLPDDESHADAWFRTDCLDCHERGRDDAPVVYHVGMSELLLAARCRTCHVSVEGGLEAE